MLFSIYCLVLWMILGFVVLWSVTSIHLYKADKKGYYSYRYWYENGPDIFNEIDNFPMRFVFGLIIWPIRLGQFISSIDGLYEAYEMK